jgi:hypothetical protein
MKPASTKENGSRDGMFRMEGQVMNLGELNKKLADARLVYLLAAALLVIGISTAVRRLNPGAQLMFVQAAEDVRADEKAHSLRLVNAGQTLYFSDRPVRVAGHIRMEDYLKTWNQGKDSFAKDNPNATLSVFEPGRPDNTLVVVEISSPVVDGRDIVYTYKLLDGTMPASGGASTLFIDWVAARPGVGAGGVGRPGVGAGGGGGTRSRRSARRGRVSAVMG